MAETTGVLRDTMDEVKAQIGEESPAVQHLPWKTDIIRIGQQGVNLAAKIDALQPTELAQLTNGVMLRGGGIQTRPGLTSLIAGGSHVHSAYRLKDTRRGSSLLIWGVDSQVATGESGAFNGAGGGFSGSPLSIAAWESEYSGEPWAFIADRNRMMKLSSSGVSLPIGLPKAAQYLSTVAQDPLITLICDCTPTDGTDSTKWVAIQGEGLDGNLPAIPTIYGSPGDVQMAIGPGACKKGYWAAASIAHTADASFLIDPAGKHIPTTDDDLIHLSMRINTPSVVDEVRLYFVVGPFTNGKIPGKEYVTTGAQPNSSSYVRAFRASDYTQFLQVTEAAHDAALRDAAAQFPGGGRLRPPDKQVIGYAVNRDPNDTRPTAQRMVAAQEAFAPIQQDPSTTISSAQLPGADVWVEYGVLGLPLRRGDFLKVGDAGKETHTWADIQGIVVVVLMHEPKNVTVAFNRIWITGGYDPDVSEPDSPWYDYRICNVDKRTGARSNPCDIVYDDPPTNKNVHATVPCRQLVTIHPASYGDSNIYQEAYRRGGATTDSWYGPVGDNKATGDGTPIIDTMSDVQALATGTIEFDHDQPVTTTAPNGDAIYGQPLGFLLPGPINGYLIGGGDPYRPGDIYWSKQGEPDHWPAFNHQQICPPSEALLNGGMYGGQAFVFSHERMYAVQVGIGDPPISSNPTDCAQGLIGRNALAVGPGGIYFCSRDALRVTLGGLSKPISDNIRPLFYNERINLYPPIDFTKPDEIRVSIAGDDLWFGFLDAANLRHWWVFSIIYGGWRHVAFIPPTGLVYTDTADNAGVRILVGGQANGKAYVHTGLTDDGTLFEVHARTGALYAQSREEKLLGDLALYGDMGGTDFNVTTLLDAERVVNPTAVAGNAPGYREYLFPGFGIQPQHATSVSIDVSWLSGSPTPATLQQIGLATAVQPEVTMTRATTWQPVNPSTGEAYLTGVWIDCDTFGNVVPVYVESLLGGVRTIITTLSITSSAGRRLWFDWPAVHVDMIRLRPAEPCAPWMLYGQGWLWRPEPARLPGMDSGFVNLSETYYTGLDLEIDTFGQDKLVSVEVDGVLLSDPATGSPFWTVNANGRLLRHITLPWGRGHIYRFYSTDAVPVLLYTSKWHLAEEPSEQHNWNQNFTSAGTFADKWIKGILLECDTYGATKLINVEVDDIPVPGGPFPVSTPNRRVVQLSFPQVLGRVFRIWPADHFPGRLYSSAWLFDQEPYQLTRFETQEIRLDIDDFKVNTYGMVTYKAAADVTMRVLVYGNSGQLIATDDYVFPSTANLKAMAPHRPQARKGVLYKYIFTSTAGFWLYREESWMEFQPFQGGQSVKIKPFGNDDLDESRSMVNAGLVAARSGGGA